MPSLALLSTREIARELATFEVELPEAAVEQLSRYLKLLLRWNRRINLTGLREPRTIVRRLFGESLYLARLVELRGWLVDVGSGAGFPGLALKLAAPALRITLVESNHRKCAFLKEVVRECGFSAVDVVAARFEDWCDARADRERADFVTTRAVNMDSSLLDAIGTTLAGKGKGAFLTTAALAESICKQGPSWDWEPVHAVPQARNSVILVGTRKFI